MKNKKKVVFFVVEVLVLICLLFLLAMDSCKEKNPNRDSGVEQGQEDVRQEDGNQEGGNQKDGSQEDGNQEEGTQEDGNQEDGNQADGNQEDGNQEDGNQEDGSQENENQADGNQEDENSEDADKFPYRIRISRADFSIFKEPSYDSSYAGAVKVAGTYTIVEEQEDEEGNLWGKLKSGAGWVDLTLIEAEKEKPKTPIAALFADGISLTDGEYYWYRAEEIDPPVKMLFYANETLEDVVFSMLEYDGTGYVVWEELYRFDTWEKEKPFVAEVYFYGDLTSYGLSFTDADGNNRNFAVYISGRNGALTLVEY